MRQFACCFNEDMQLFNSVLEETEDGDIECKDLFGFSPDQVKNHFEQMGEEVDAYMVTFS